MHRKKPTADSRITLPITPMLDMTFQLLFFFVINFNPADLEGQMDMALPSENVTASHKKEDVSPLSNPNKDKQPEFPTFLTISVRTQAGEDSQGGISAIQVEGLEGKAEPVRDLDGLYKYLKEKRAGLPAAKGKDKDQQEQDGIKVRGDGQLRVKYVMKVMDVCRKAGFEKISFVPPEEFGR